MARSWFVMALVISLCAVSPATAVEYGNVGGHPAYPDPKIPRSKSIFIHTLEPNESAKDAVRVVNYTAETKTLEIYATDSLISSGGAFGCAQKVEKKQAAGSWINLSTNEVTLTPKTERIVPFTITAPKTASVGSSDACIVIQEKQGTSQTVKQNGGGSIALSFRTAIRVALLVPGNIIKKLSFIDYSAISQPNGNTVLQAKIKNDGNVSLDANLTVSSHNIFNLQKKQSSHEFPILRGAVTDWNVEFKRPFWGGLITSSAFVHYDANTDNELGSQADKTVKTLSSRTIHFISWPTPLALAIELLALLLLVGATFRVRHNFQQKKWVAKFWMPYTVKDTDSINSLAKKYDVSWKLLAKTNKLKPPYALRAGDKIKVPPKTKS